MATPKLERLPQSRELIPGTPSWSVRTESGVAATYGAVAFRDGCAFWFTPGPEFKAALRWIAKNLHEMLATVCFGRYVVITAINGDRAMEMLAAKAGFEVLEVQDGSTLHYLSIK